MQKREPLQQGKENGVETKTHIHGPGCGCSTCEIAGCNCVDCKCSMEIRDLSVRKKDGLILDKIHLKVTHGEIMAIIGRNGAGKSTLLKAVLGRIPYTGSISYTNHKGESIQRPKIGYVPQNLVFDRTSPTTAADMLCANLSRFPVWLGHRKESLEKAEALLKRVGASGDLLKKRLGNLRGRGVVLKDGQTLKDLYEERVPLYEQYADITVDEKNTGAEETLQKILQVLER